MKEVVIESIDIDSRVLDSVPFDEGDEVSLRTQVALGAFLRANGESISGKLHSDGETFAFQVGIRSGRITLK